MLDNQIKIFGGTKKIVQRESDGSEHSTQARLVKSGKFYSKILFKLTVYYYTIKILCFKCLYSEKSK